MSIERCVEELYGDTLDEHCKQEEIARLKAEQGIADVEVPGIRQEAGAFQIGGVLDEGKSGTKNIPNDPEGVSGALGNS